MKGIGSGDRMPPVKDPGYLKRFVFILLFCFLHYFIFRNAFLLSQDLQFGNLSGEKISPAPQYRFLRIPNSPLANQYEAQNRLAGDFAQIYFPLKQPNGLKEDYISGTYDPWLRPSRIAPVIHHLCAISYCRLNYGPSSLVHLYLQLALFYTAFIFAFVTLKISRHLPLAILLVNAGLFLTPAGLAWFERGQYSLYVAMAYLFIVMGIIKNRPLYFVLGGFFAFVKWTSFPAIFVMISIYLLASRNIESLKSSILRVAPMIVLIVLLLVPFPEEGYLFVQGLLRQEAFIPPGGVSLLQILPATYVKLMPVALILLGISYIRKYGEDLTGYIPFFAGESILMLTYPTVAFEYSLCSLFCFIPLVIYWSEYQNGTSSSAARSTLKYMFLVFLPVASGSPYLAWIFHSQYAIFWLYALVSVILLIVPLQKPFDKATDISPVSREPRGIS